jgi:hypothetical protein
MLFVLGSRTTPSSGGLSGTDTGADPPLVATPTRSQWRVFGRRPRASSGMAYGIAGVTSAGDEVGARRETLQELVLRRLRELGDESGPISSREAVRGFESLISYENLRLIARGVHQGKISDRTAEGLSAALRVPPSVVYAAAGVPSPGTRWRWPQRFDRLSPRQREMVEQFAAALLDAYDQGRRDATDQ